MKLPRLSINAVMVVVFVVAVDCMAFRSIQSRSNFLGGVAEVMLLGSLPMANILAVMVSHRIGLRGAARRFQIGFFVVGALALLATVIGLKPGLRGLESVLEHTAVGSWLESSEVAVTMVAFIAIPGLLLTLQLVAGWGAGSLVRRLRGGLEAAPTAVAPRRYSIPRCVAMAALIAAPAFVTEGYLRWTIGPPEARLTPGTVAVVDAKVSPGCVAYLKDRTSLVLMNGAEVRINDDGQPTSMAAIVGPSGEQFGDHRPVHVTLLDGARAGEMAMVPRQLIRQIR